jgi:SAM-dependent methyltransferase
MLSKPFASGAKVSPPGNASRQKIIARSAAARLVMTSNRFGRLAQRIGGRRLRGERHSASFPVSKFMEEQMPKIADPWDHHDWDSADYVSEWAARQDQRETERREVFQLIARTLPYEPQAAIRILDLGAGYGALSRFLLDYFPRASAVCQDGSAAMARLGRRRMAHFKGRFKYALGDFGKPGWSRKLPGPFEAVVSSIAIHNVRSHQTIRAIYDETYSLVIAGGCFVNFDRMTPSLKEQIKWLKEAGFVNVTCFWDGGRRALIGGFRG